MPRNRSGPALRSEVGETEAGGGWTTAWSAAAQGTSSQALHVVLPPWHLLNKCGCLGLLPLTPTPPEVAWVTRYQVLWLWDAGGGWGGREGPFLEQNQHAGRDRRGPGRGMQLQGCLKDGEHPPTTGHLGSEGGQGSSSAEPPKSRLASGETCWFQAISEPVGTHIPLKALS